MSYGFDNKEDSSENNRDIKETIRGVIYAKVTDKETQQTKWVYSEEVRLTNK